MASVSGKRQDGQPDTPKIPPLTHQRVTKDYPVWVVRVNNAFVRVFRPIAQLFERKGKDSQTKPVKATLTISSETSELIMESIEDEENAEVDTSQYLAVVDSIDKIDQDIHVLQSVRHLFNQDEKIEALKQKRAALVSYKEQIESKNPDYRTYNESALQLAQNLPINVGELQKILSTDFDEMSQEDLKKLAPLFFLLGTSKEFLKARQTVSDITKNDTRLTPEQVTLIQSFVEKVENEQIGPQEIQQLFKYIPFYGLTIAEQSSLIARLEEATKHAKNPSKGRALSADEKVKVALLLLQLKRFSDSEVDTVISKTPVNKALVSELKNYIRSQYSLKASHTSLKSVTDEYNKFKLEIATEFPELSSTSLEYEEFLLKQYRILFQDTTTLFMIDSLIDRIDAFRINIGKQQSWLETRKGVLERITNLLSKLETLKPGDNEKEILLQSLGEVLVAMTEKEDVDLTSSDEVILSRLRSAETRHISEKDYLLLIQCYRALSNSQPLPQSVKQIIEILTRSKGILEQNIALIESALEEGKGLKGITLASTQHSLNTDLFFGAKQKYPFSKIPRPEFIALDFVRKATPTLGSGEQISFSIGKKAEDIRTNQMSFDQLLIYLHAQGEQGVNARWIEPALWLMGPSASTSVYAELVPTRYTYNCTETDKIFFEVTFGDLGEIVSLQATRTQVEYFIEGPAKRGDFSSQNKLSNTTVVISQKMTVTEGRDGRFICEESDPIMEVKVLDPYILAKERVSDLDLELLQTEPSSVGDQQLTFLTTIFRKWMTDRSSRDDFTLEQRQALISIYFAVAKERKLPEASFKDDVFVMIGYIQMKEQAENSEKAELAKIYLEVSKFEFLLLFMEVQSPTIALTREQESRLAEIEFLSHFIDQFTDDKGAIDTQKVAIIFTKLKALEQKTVSSMKSFISSFQSYANENTMDSLEDKFDLYSSEDPTRMIVSTKKSIDVWSPLLRDVRRGAIWYQDGTFVMNSNKFARNITRETRALEKIEQLIPDSEWVFISQIFLGQTVANAQLGSIGGILKFVLSETRAQAIAKLRREISASPRKEGSHEVSFEDIERMSNEAKLAYLENQGDLSEDLEASGFSPAVSTVEAPVNIEVKRNDAGEIQAITFTALSDVYPVWQGHTSNIQMGQEPFKINQQVTLTRTIDGKFVITDYRFIEDSSRGLVSEFGDDISEVMQSHKNKVLAEDVKREMPAIMDHCRKEEHNPKSKKFNAAAFKDSEFALALHLAEILRVNPDLYDVIEGSESQIPESNRQRFTDLLKLANEIYEEEKKVRTEIAELQKQITEYVRSGRIDPKVEFEIVGKLRGYKAENPSLQARFQKHYDGLVARLKTGLGEEEAELAKKLDRLQSVRDLSDSLIKYCEKQAARLDDEGQTKLEKEKHALVIRLARVRNDDPDLYEAAKVALSNELEKFKHEKIRLGDLLFWCEGVAYDERKIKELESEILAYLEKGESSRELEMKFAIRYVSLKPEGPYRDRIQKLYDGIRSNIGEAREATNTEKVSAVLNCIFLFEESISFAKANKANTSKAEAIAERLDKLQIQDDLRRAFTSSFREVLTPNEVEFLERSIPAKTLRKEIEEYCKGDDVDFSTEQNFARRLLEVQSESYVRNQFDNFVTSAKASFDEASLTKLQRIQFYSIVEENAELKEVQTELADYLFDDTISLEQERALVQMLAEKKMGKKLEDSFRTLSEKIQGQATSKLNRIALYVDLHGISDIDDKKKEELSTYLFNDRVVSFDTEIAFVTFLLDLPDAQRESVDKIFSLLKVTLVTTGEKEKLARISFYLEFLSDKNLQGMSREAKLKEFKRKIQEYTNGFRKAQNAFLVGNNFHSGMGVGQVSLRFKSESEHTANIEGDRPLSQLFVKDLQRDGILYFEDSQVSQVGESSSERVDIVYGKLAENLGEQNKDWIFPSQILLTQILQSWAAFSAPTCEGVYEYTESLDPEIGYGYNYRAELNGNVVFMKTKKNDQGEVEEIVFTALTDLSVALGQTQRFAAIPGVVNKINEQITMRRDPKSGKFVFSDYFVNTSPNRPAITDLPRHFELANAQQEFYNRFKYVIKEAKTSDINVLIENNPIFFKEMGADIPNLLYVWLNDPSWLADLTDDQKALVIAVYEHYETDPVREKEITAHPRYNELKGLL